MKSIKTILVGFVLISAVPSAFALNLNPDGRHYERIHHMDNHNNHIGSGGGYWHFKIHAHDVTHQPEAEAEPVPEIDASSISLAAAMIGSLLAFVRERRKKLINKA